MKFKYKVMLYTMLMLACFYAFGSFVMIFVSFQYSLEKDTQSALSSHQIVQNMMLLMKTDDSKSTSSLIESLELNEASSWNAILVFDINSSEYFYEDGIIPYDITYDDLQRMEEEECYLIRNVVTENGHIVQISGLVTIYSRQLLLETCRDITEVYETRSLQLEISRIILAFVLLSGGICSYIISSRLTAPIRKLQEASKKIAEGDLSFRADVKSGDEIEELSDDFNMMAKRVENNLQEMSASMQRQDEFMGSFAHELKTPMTSIIGYADLLRGQNLDPQEQQEAANTVFHEAKRLENLSFKMLDLMVTGNEKPEFRKTSPKRLAEETAAMLRPSLEKKNITVRILCEDGFCMLEPDLTQALIMNLADNAVKAIDRDGVVVITSRMSGTGCEICVADNGRGMEEKELDRITEAFYRVDKSRSREQGGAGLGLALCSRIVKLHNGEMKFRSSLGKGTAVIVSLNGGRA